MILPPFSLERTLKLLHGWLGVFILPWVVVIGLTGLSLNHWNLIRGWVTPPSYDEALFDTLPRLNVVSKAEAITLSRLILNESLQANIEQDRYHGRAVWLLDNDEQELIVGVVRQSLTHIKVLRSCNISSTWRKLSG